MKFIRNAFYVGLLCLLLLVLLRAVRPLKDPDRIWVGGVELTEAGEIPTVSGRAISPSSTGPWRPWRKRASA